MLPIVLPGGTVTLQQILHELVDHAGLGDNRRGELHQAVDALEEVAVVETEPVPQKTA